MEDNTIINFDKFLDNHSFSEEQLKKRKENYKKFNDEGFPNKKLEDWKFSDLNQIIKKNIKNFVIEKSETNKSQDTDLIKDFDHNKIYIQDGKLISYDFSFEKEKSLKLNIEEVVENKINTNSLLNLNSALSEDKISIIVKEGYITNAPLVIYNNYSEKKSNLINSNISINLEKNSSLKIINLSNENSINSFSNNSQNIYLSDNAILKFYSLNYKNNTNMSYSFSNIDLNKNSHCEYFILSAGAKFLKNEINCSLNENHGSIFINGIINLENENHHEIKTIVNHNEENCKSYQLIKCVLNDNSKGIYQGKIFVDSKAQKTDGYQLSRALLLNEDTEFNAKPELEIYADDVKCSHGSTSGNIDKDALFYLKARGIDSKEAVKMIIKGFLETVLEKIKNKEIMDILLNHFNKHIKYEKRSN